MSQKKILTQCGIEKQMMGMAMQIKINEGKENLAIYGVPRGGIPVAYLLANYLKGSRITDKPRSADIIVDDILDSSTTAKRYMKEYGKPFYALYNKKEEPNLPWLIFPWEQSEEKSIEDACLRLLQFAGEDPTREGLKETPARMAKAWQFWTSGYDMDPKAVFKEFEDGGEKYDQMIMLDPIPFYSHCEHHMAAIFGNAYIAYIPNGKIAGLSKFPRLVDIFARRLQVQERLTTQIADTINEELKPRGVAVLIKARHFCMESRGVQKAGVSTKTSAMRGDFLNDPATRNEFFSLIKI